jgi:nicotinamide mononucleotide transporter
MSEGLDQRLGLELAANAVTAVSIVLAGYNSIHTWWAGILGCLLFALLFHATQLYADVTLQVFFVATGVWGWWRWSRRTAGSLPPVSGLPAQQLAWMLPAAAASAWAYAAMLHAWTDAYAPLPDSVVLAFSVLGQWLLVQRRVQTWPVWLLVNCVAVPLYASRGLWITAALYTAYAVHAVVGWRRWHRLASAAPRGAS